MRLVREENVKHLSESAFLKELDHAEVVLLNLIANTRAIVKQTPLGIMGRLADQAYQIVLEKGRFTSHDCTCLGVLDTTQKKRLFSALKAYHPDIRIDLRCNYNDRRKIYVAWIDDKKLEEAQKDPDQPIKEFVEKYNPTREQLITHFGWGGNGGKKIGTLVNLKKILLDQNTGKFTWIKD